MGRKILIGIIVLLGMFIALLFWSEQQRERQFKWDYNLNSFSKQPYGTKVFFGHLQDIFPGKKIKRIHKVNFNQYFSQNRTLDSLSIQSLQAYRPSFPQDSIASYGLDFNFINIQNYLNPNPSMVDALINHAVEGGNIQLYAFNFSELLAERLEFKMRSKRKIFNSSPPIQTTDSANLFMGDQQKGIELRRKPSNFYFESFPEEAEVILRNDFEEVLGIKLKMGYGSISLFTVPHVFSNYDLLHFNRQLAELMLNQLPPKDTYWSNHINYQTDFSSNKSLLSFIKNNPSLKWAYYLLLISVVLYLALLVQRKQRPIPELLPPQNLSLSFLRTLSDLHASKRDLKSILRKKMNFLLAEIKSKYHLDSTKINSFFYKQLAKRSSIDEKHIVSLFENYRQLMEADDITDREFKSICQMFQRFKQ